VTIYQILVPGVVSKFNLDSVEHVSDPDGDEFSVHHTYEKVSGFFDLEPLEEMLESNLTQKML
jgi:hypothetical protein